MVKTDVFQYLKEKMLRNHLNDKWESILEDCLTDHGFVTFRLTIARKTDVKCKGLLLSVTVEGRKDREFKVGFLTMKTLGDSEEDVKRDQVDRMFSTESFVYNEVIKKFENIQADLAKSVKFLFPLCYKSTEEYVLMEDLSMKNFVMKDGVNVLDFNHMSLALVELGRFHSFSFALKQKNLDEFNKFAKELKYDFFTYDRANSDTFNSVLKRTLEAINDVDMKNKLKTSCIQIWDKIQNLVKKENTHKAICHGDFTSENICFTYDEVLLQKYKIYYFIFIYCAIFLQNEEPSEVVMIDYQFSTISSPVTDALCLLLTSGSEDTIREYEKMLDMYHDSMKYFLKKFQCLIDEYYHKDILKKDIVEYFPYVLARTLFAIDAMYPKEENSTKFKDKINYLIRILCDLKFI